MAPFPLEDSSAPPELTTVVVMFEGMEKALRARYPAFPAVSFSPLPNDSNSIIFSSVRFGRRSRHGESWFAHSTVQSD